MATATITGTLADFGFTPLAAYQPQIVFTPSGPAVVSASQAFLLASRPIVVTPAADGSFTVTLTQTDTLRPACWYTISIQWLDAAGNYVSVDFPDWKLFVPAAGGGIVDLIETPWNPALIWVGPTEPPGAPTSNTLWLNSITGDLKRWS